MMEERQSFGSVVDLVTETSRSGFKLMREKRSALDMEGNNDSLELSCKRTKMRDLESVFRSEDNGMEKHNLDSLRDVPIKERFHIGKNEETSGITREHGITMSDGFRAVTTGQSILSQPSIAACSRFQRVDYDFTHMGLNTKAQFTFSKNDQNHDPNTVSSRVMNLDVDETSNSADKNPFYPYKVPGCLKSSAASECGSSTGPLEENDSYKVWNEMKRNGFLSSAHGGIPVPAPRGRKKRSDPLKKKMELAKREQIHRFTKVAAPSGLLNGLNPGIINHVRNSKQVRSIIEALVRSERFGNSNQGRSAENLKGGMKDNNDKGKNPENIHDTGTSQFGVFTKPENTNISSGNRQTKEYPLSSSALISEHKGGCGNFENAERLFNNENSGPPCLASDCGNEMLTLKLSSSITTASENMSNEDSANNASVSSLSIKAATVASQWLELLQQDIRGRLAALRRSKKRVQDVIQTELPFLASKEFSSTQESDLFFRQPPLSSCPNTATSNMHRARWTSLFDQMDKALNEEAKKLENRLNQVKEMQLQCEQGLQFENWHALHALARSEIAPRSEKENMEKKLAVRAAAASIYSTCNFVKATEDVSCF
ncbi:hypothetical protein IFM89_003497 [Coptis chinensis]|uniref:Uncharacterized protein n=1 Tax=Coptis chinensis TaxID=261450 RepID=A0A835HB42_9MAGN|nr:hypothetical protein IFM89_003497 [Coptis chinensis]